MKRIDTEALTLRSYNLDDSSRIVVCLTADQGVIRGVATGARRLKSQFGASFEPFTLVNLSYYEKEGKELVLLRSAEIQKSFFGLAGVERVTFALGRFSQLLMEFAAPAEPNENLFRMVKACLFAAEKNPAQVSLIVLYFEIWLLRLMGFMPDWTACDDCGSSLETGTAWLETEHKVSCVNCKSGRGLAVKPETLSLFRSARRHSPALFFANSDRVGSGAISDAFAITGYLLDSVLAPKSLPRIGFDNRDITGELNDRVALGELSSAKA
ncbi:MAG: DNA repair protein RecO [Pyrinomonadaceae bacterium]